MVEPQRTSSPSCWTNFVNFMCSPKGTILIIEIIFCIVVLCCFKGVEYYHLSGAELVLGIFFFIMYAGSLKDYITWISWPWCDFFRTFVAALLYLISSIPSLSVRGSRAAAIEGSVGLFATFLFGCDAFLSFPLRR